jgi:hypothetical protein
MMMEKLASKYGGNWEYAEQTVAKSMGLGRGGGVSSE